MELNKGFKQNNFSRSLINDAKMGSYFTDTNHCRRIGDLLAFPEEEVCVLEPSIGDGEGVLAVTRDCAARRIYGVELNSETFQETKKKNEFCVIHEDFLRGVKISNRCFSLCFSNPPYGEDKENHERLEKLFMEKFFGYLTPGAVLAYVIPYYVLMDEKFLKPFFARFHIKSVYKFDEREYKKFQQVVILATRREAIGFRREELEDYLPTIMDLDNIPHLPQEGTFTGDRLQVPPSEDSHIVYFTTLKFNAVEAAQHMKNSSLFSLIEKNAITPTYLATELGHPAVPLKKDLLYLCAVSGGGQGLTGTQEMHDLHLQRGVAKVITENEVIQNGDKKTLIEKSFTKIILSIIQNDGSITVLE